MADQLKRQTSLSLQLGGGQREQLKLVRLDAYEALSEAFTITIEVLALAELKLIDALGKPALVKSMIDNEVLRHFHGIVVDGRFVEEIEGSGFLYRLTLAPSSRFHEQGSNFRIFQQKSVIDIVKSVLEGCKIDYKVNTSGGARTLAYCVQYGESDFAFVCRLLEEDGLYYFYQHLATGHRMMICDKPGSHVELAPSTLVFNPRGGLLAQSAAKPQGAGPQRVFVNSWHEHAASGAETKVTLRDFDFTRPAKAREAVTSDVRAHDQDVIEVYSWPGRYYQESDGQALSAVVLESRRAQRLSYEVTSSHTGIQTGFTFSLDKHPNGRFNRKYLIVRCRTQLANEQYRTGMRAETDETEFTAIPDDVQFRAPLVTPRPTAKGPETALVTGPGGEEIHVDEFGRVKVQFHWDREGAQDDHSSCWIRVSQTGGLGNIIIPRIGHEVLIDFINGNPDRPIIVGRVFNATHKPVYSLPANKTRSLWRTKTYKQDSGSDLGDAAELDTGKPGANEVRFEDATGKEELFVHAERDMNSRVRYNQTLHVGKDVEIKVGKNRTEEVGENETITILMDRTEEVKGKEDVTVVGDRTVEIKSNDSLDVSQKITIHAGTEIDISAGSKITISVGGSSITIDAASIKVATTMLEMSAKTTAKLSAPMTTVEGSGVLTAKGGMVMIN